MEEEVKHTFALQEAENSRLRKEVSEVVEVKTEMQQRFVALEKKVHEEEFIIGEDTGSALPSAQPKPSVA